ncbi:MAG: MoaD/ThiS family protein [Oscillospiraceae bacterium]|nr:MoaD/ThiS family protein [Oscillospiraceae bacterium]
MASVTVRYRGQLAVLTGVGSEALNADTVRDIIKRITDIGGAEAGKLAKAMLIVVDGESISLRKGLATRLRDGETVQFLPICGGG